MKVKQPKILFFIDGPVPSEADQVAVYELNTSVVFRNAQHVFSVDEECDGVAGDVPKAYANYPTAAEALKIYRTDIKAMRAKMKEVGGAAPGSDEERANEVLKARQAELDKDLDRNADKEPSNNDLPDPNKPTLPAGPGAAPGAQRGDTKIEDATKPPIDTTTAPSTGATGAENIGKPEGWQKR